MKNVLALVLAIVLFVVSCKKEEELPPYENHSIKIDGSNNIPPKLKADFEIFINLDSGLNYQFINRSKNFSKAIWDFGDGVKSNELNPSHEYLKGGTRTIKLIIENQIKQKDSLTISYSPPFNNYQNECEFFLTDIENKGYSVFNIKIYGGDGKFSYSIGPNYVTNPIQFEEYFSFKTHTTNKTPFITYYTANKVTTYKRHYTLDLKDFYKIVPDLGSPAYFSSRYFDAYPNDIEYFNDTLLNIHFYDGYLELLDTVLGHRFGGYLSSYSTSNTYKFAMPNKEQTTSGLEMISITISKTNSNISAEHIWANLGSRPNIRLNYNGVRQ